MGVQNRIKKKKDLLEYLIKIVSTAFHDLFTIL